MSRHPQLIEAIAAEEDAFIRLRRDLHAHPELCFEETGTADRIVRSLTAWGIPAHRGLGKTGVVAVIKGGDGRGAIGLRADIDALPMTEKNTFPHASVHRGRMHGCGHDGHTAMLLAAAKYLATNRPFDGTIYLIFQPAEEGGVGAREMMKDGLFDRFPMDAIFGLHNWPGIPAGHFAIKPGAMSASCNDFRIVIRGKGTHAAMPHNGVDPVFIACHLVQAFQGIITRNKRPIETGVISVTIIHAGEATNVIPESCELRGTVRTFSLETLDLIERRMRQVATGTCQAFEATCDFEFRRICPPTVNHHKETEFVRNVLTALVGEQRVQEFEPTMGAEDFSFFLLERPGCYFVIGNGDGEHRIGGHGEGPCMLHNPSYDFNDELISLGASMWVRLVESWFAPDHI